MESSTRIIEPALITKIGLIAYYEEYSYKLDELDVIQMDSDSKGIFTDKDKNEFVLFPMTLPGENTAQKALIRIFAQVLSGEKDLSIEINENGPSKVAIPSLVEPRKCFPRKSLWIQGECEANEFCIYFDPLRLSSNDGWIEINGNKKKVCCDLTNFSCLTPHAIIKAVFSLPHAQFTSYGDSHIFKIFRKKTPDFSVTNTQELGKALKTNPDTESWLYLVVNEMVLQLPARPNADQLREIAEIADFVTVDNKREIIRKILGSLKSQVLTSSLLDGLISILSKIRVSNEKAIYDYLFSQSDVDKGIQDLNYYHDKFNGVLHQDLVKMLEVLTGILEKSRSYGRAADPFSIEGTLDVINLVLQMMITGGMNHLPQAKHEIFYPIIKNWKNHENFRISYLASLGCQLLTHIHYDETGNQAVFNTLKKLFTKALVPFLKSTFSGSMDPVTVPLKALVALPEAVIQACSELEKLPDLPQPDWFPLVFSYLWSASVDLNYVLSRQMPENSHFFVIIGYLEILRKTLLDDGIAVSVRKKAIRILREVYNANQSAGDPVPFRANGTEEELSNLRKYALALLMQAKKFESLQSTAQAQYPFLTSDDPIVLPALNTIDLPKDLFNEAFRRKVPLEWRLRKILRDDVNFQKELQYYRPLTANVNEKSINPILRPIDEAVRDFLKSTEKTVLVITGAAGSGKSFFTKKFAWEQLNNQRSENLDDPLVIFASLPKLGRKKVSKNIINNILEEYGIQLKSDSLLEERLKERKILWILDGYDEIQFKEVNGKLNFIYMHVTNGFEDWKKSKVLFTCREGFCNEKLFMPQLSGKSLTANYTFKFSEKGALDDHLAAYSKEKRLGLVWGADRYSKVLYALSKCDVELDTLYPSPFLFKAILIALPNIEKQLREELREEITTGMKNKKKEEVLVKHQDPDFEKFLETKKEKVINAIHDAVACVTVVRALQKNQAYPENDSLEAEEILEYCKQIALAMHESVQETFLIRDLTQNKSFQKKMSELLKNIDEDSRQKREVLLRTTCLICNDNKWQFIDKGMIFYFAKKNISELLSLLTNNTYGFNDHRFYQ